jgi:hypothetical protein
MDYRFCPVKQLWPAACVLYTVILKFKNTYMKKFSKSIRCMLATLLIVVVSQVTVLAEGNASSKGSGSGLTALQVTGAFILLVLVILIPLVKSNKAVTQK